MQSAMLTSAAISSPIWQGVFWFIAASCRASWGLRLTVLCRFSVVQLALEKDLNLKQIKFFVIDECDKVLEKLGKTVAHLGLHT